jgi:hypothetical protein
MTVFHFTQPTVDAAEPTFLRARASENELVALLASPQGPVAVRAGVLPAEADALLEEYGCRHWAVISAANPHALTLSGRENELRLRNLRRDIEAGGHRWLAATVEVDGVQTAAYLVFDISPRGGTALGRAYAQRKILYGEGRAVAALPCGPLDFVI